MRTKALYKGLEVVILEYYETHKWDGTACRYAKCYFSDLECVEGILLTDIEVVGL